jgi:hypothetical protein
VINPAVERAIQEKLGISPEKGSGALRDLTTLTVSRAFGIQGIDFCENLEILIMAGCDVRAIPEVQGLRNLLTYVSTDSALENIEGLAGLRVDTVHLKRGRVFDISPLLNCPNLIDVELAGNPLSVTSFREVIPELSRRGCRISAPGESEHKLMLMLREKGLPFSYYQSRKGYRLCRPGLHLTNAPEVNHPLVNPDELESMLKTNPVLVEGLFSRTSS